MRLAQANFDDAHRQFDDAIKTANETGNHIFVAQCRVKMAALPLATGHAADADAILRDSLALFDREHHTREALEAHTLLAAALLDEGKPADARQELDRAAAPVNASQKLAAAWRPPPTPHAAWTPSPPKTRSTAW